MKITFNEIRNKELGALAHRIIKASKEGEYTVVENQPLLLEVEKKYAHYYKSYNKPAYSGKGKEVAKADTTRDQVFRKIRAFLKASKEEIITPKYAEAGALYEVFQSTGIGSNMLNYAEKTAVMRKLIEELEQPKNVEKIASLQLTQAFEELKIAQTRFEKLYAEQAEANAKLRATPNATTIRSELEQALRNYFNLLNAMKDQPDWEMIYAEINEVIKKL